MQLACCYCPSVWPRVSVCSIRFFTKHLSMAICVGVFHPVHYQAPQYGHMCVAVFHPLPSTSVWPYMSVCSIRFITKHLSMATRVGVFHPVHYQTPQYGHMCRCVPSGSLPSTNISRSCFYYKFAFKISRSSVQGEHVQIACIATDKLQ